MEHAADQDVDFEILKQPRFWQYTPTENAWTHSSEGDATVPTPTQNDAASNSLDPATNAGNVVSNSFNSSNSSSSLRATGQYSTQIRRVAHTVQRKITSKEAGQRQLLSAKQMQRLAVKGERCYLAMVFAQQKQKNTTNPIQMGHQGMT